MMLLKDYVEGPFSQSWTTQLQQILVVNAHTAGKYMAGNTPDITYV